MTGVQTCALPISGTGSGAAAVLSDAAYDEALLQNETAVVNHQNAGNIELIVIRGKELMKLVHALYERASNEA